MNLFRKSSSNHTTVGVQFTAEGVALTQVRPRWPDVSRSSLAAPSELSDASQVLLSEWLPESDSARQTSLLEERVERLGLKRSACHLVLGPDDYNLLLIEAPAVPANELRDAVRWRIRELIDFPADQAVLDAFLLPEDRTRGGKRMAYVAVARRPLIQERIAQIEEARLTLKVIDIPELAMRNVAEQVCDTSRGAAVVKLGAGTGSLHIVRDGDLHLARRFNLPYHGGLMDDLPADVLVLELQRSLDYFERQMRQPPPGHVYLVGENVTPDKLTDNIHAGLSMSVSLLDPAASLALAEPVQEHTLALCLDALGAALRHPSEKGV